MRKKNGMKRIRLDGYCSYEDFKRGLDAFFEATRPKRNPIDEAEARRYPNLRDACPICGRVLTEGKCLSCGIRPYENY